MSDSSNGKGDRPRNCFSEEFRNNYDQINWKRKEEVNTEEVKNLDKEVSNTDIQNTN